MPFCRCAIGRRYVATTFVRRRGLILAIGGQGSGPGGLGIAISARNSLFHLRTRRCRFPSRVSDAPPNNRECHYQDVVFGWKLFKFEVEKHIKRDLKIRITPIPCKYSHNSRIFPKGTLAMAWVFKSGRNGRGKRKNGQ